MADFIIYTDGGYSTSNNVGSGAYIILESDGQTLVSQGSFTIRKETSQRAEFKAIIAALDALPDGCTAQIYTDNLSAALGLGKTPKRKGKPDHDLLLHYRHLVSKKNISVEFQWIRSHKGNTWNELCDSLCTEALTAAEITERSASRVQPSTAPQTLSEFIESQIIPRYEQFDKAHRADHARAVISRALDLSAYYPVDKNILYAAAACHDLGLSVDRKTHHLESGRIIREMPELRNWFTEEEIEIIAQAAEDHRASSDHEPRSIYGRIVAEADRLIEPEQIIRRTIQYGLAHYPEFPKEGHWERTLEHLHEKYAEGGYLKLWMDDSPNAAPLADLRTLIKNEKKLRALFDDLFNTLKP